MAFKCKHCGYVFKKTDSDLCPECFTARDDVDCMDFEKRHSHEKVTYTGSYDHPDIRPSSKEKPISTPTPQYRSQAMNDLYGMFSGDTDPRNRRTGSYDASDDNNSRNNTDANQKATKIFIIVFLLFFLFPILSAVIGVFATFFDILNM